MNAKVIGAGLSGCEAAWQLAQAGIPVSIYEMRPAMMTKAHQTGLCAELVCSNSLRGADLTNAVGLLKEELSCWGSLIMEAAQASRIPAGGAFAVDRQAFSEYIDAKIRIHPLISFCLEEIAEIPHTAPGNAVIIATGPLTSERLTFAMKQLTGEKNLAFFDAISPTIVSESINYDECFFQSRYQKGDGEDYLNIPLEREQYYAFVNEIIQAEKHQAHAELEDDAELKPFEGCMPIEDMAARGPDTLAFGPLKPVGLINPLTGRRPYAVVQLRRDDAAGTLWNMVGMQSRMKHGEQLRIFRKLPGLAQAEFARLGSVHRSTFINSPKCLDATLQFRSRPGLFFAGQITGTEGYVESTAGGLVAGINALRYLRGNPLLTFPIETATGSLMAYISQPDRTDFQPMNISYGLIPGYAQSPRLNSLGKKIPRGERRMQIAERAMQIAREFKNYLS